MAAWFDSEGGKEFLERFRLVLLLALLVAAVLATLNARERWPGWYSGVELAVWRWAVWLAAAGVFASTYYPRKPRYRLAGFAAAMLCFVNLIVSDDLTRAVWLPVLVLMAFAVLAVLSWMLSPLLGKGR